MDSISLVLGCVPVKKPVFGRADSYRCSVVSGANLGDCEDSPSQLTPCDTPASRQPPDAGEQGSVRLCFESKTSLAPASTRCQHGCSRYRVGCLLYHSCKVMLFASVVYVAPSLLTKMSVDPAQTPRPWRQAERAGCRCNAPPFLASRALLGLHHILEHLFCVRVCAFVRAFVQARTCVRA